MTGSAVPRPHKKTEYQLQFGTRQAQKGWSYLEATKRNALVDAWDLLTRSPAEVSGDCKMLRGDLSVVVHDGAAHNQWQLSLPGGARIWYYVVDPTGKTPGRVVLVRVATAHPNGTK